MQFMEDYYFTHCFKLAMVNLILFLVRVGFWLFSCCMNMITYASSIGLSLCFAFLVSFELSFDIKGELKPDEAMKALTIFEGKFSRLKEERENVAKAKEALELSEPGNFVKKK